MTLVAVDDVLGVGAGVGPVGLAAEDAGVEVELDKIGFGGVNAEVAVDYGAVGGLHLCHYVLEVGHGAAVNLGAVKLSGGRADEGCLVGVGDVAVAAEQVEVADVAQGAGLQAVVCGLGLQLGGVEVEVAVVDGL